MCNLPPLSWLEKSIAKLGISTKSDSFFTVESESQLQVPDIANPINLTGMNIIREINGFELDVTTQSIKNISGRTLTMVGDMAVQFEQTGSQQAEFYVYSEYSNDGITWTFNQNSLREVAVVKTGIDYLSIPSLNIGDWEDGGYIRFMFAKEGNGGVLIESPVKTIGGVVMDGHSFIWNMRERQK